MAPVIPGPKKIKSFRTEAAFEKWLSVTHARERELWLKIHKKDSGRPTVTYAQALDVALCWGWIDGLRKSFDETSFLQRFTPRQAKSIWSQVNRGHIARLTSSGRMTAHGQRHVDAAVADGRWDAAYAPIRSASDATMPADLCPRFPHEQHEDRGRTSAKDRNARRHAGQGRQNRARTEVGGRGSQAICTAQHRSQTDLLGKGDRSTAAA